jgi:hypothetical protein
MQAGSTHVRSKRFAGIVGSGYSAALIAVHPRTRCKSESRKDYLVVWHILSLSSLVCSISHGAKQS